MRQLMSAKAKEKEQEEIVVVKDFPEADPLNPSPHASVSELDDVIEVEDMVEPKDETVPASVLSAKEGAAAMENMVRKLGNAEERAECKNLKKELEEARGVVFEERPNEAIDVLVEDEESPSSKPRGSPRDSS
uniref:Uncharacterized protein n=1 Tax=Tanacetum cinerariifolium TaxID=118510 RepID=A0A699HUK4_TANCI|nr:hypothetical protein [Tanacetum cinerariifolium]